MSGCDLDCLIQIGAVDDVEASDVLLGLAEGPSATSVSPSCTRTVVAVLTDSSRSPTSRTPRRSISSSQSASLLPAALSESAQSPASSVAGTDSSSAMISMYFTISPFSPQMPVAPTGAGMSPDVVPSQRRRHRQHDRVRSRRVLTPLSRSRIVSPPPGCQRLDIFRVHVSHRFPDWSHCGVSAAIPVACQYDER